MSSFDSKDPRDRKASSFGESTVAQASTPDAAVAVATADPGRGKLMRRRRGRGWVAVVVDLLLLCALAGLLVGGWFGYRAIRELYAPTWETRDVVFCVEIQNIAIDSLRYEQGRLSMLDNPIHSSDRTDADHLGTVRDVRIVRADGSDSLTLYLTVEATAHYRQGKGYRMGETMLLAGMEGTYRVDSLVAAGTVISMHEKQDEVEAAAGAESPADAEDTPSAGA